ncbi:unnamed protein product (macronuclear) [Paramecium tetraurelia]|uniref:Uncharacterized protein n=1 Tax=Paramecium tetraurelia TaxID=5888 RepID=A0C8Z1_PARTE|nr:uncharacterized protein GSPATT00006564001 [Paramecium tetraurelia]CAK67258.1 unnamed protein product [Paramecium tetraurelia]|eukprot:XP_001434655.1 hypothetical protein (macronuclear) [Paramecium tetraurelia strain d4-2]
MRGVIMIIIAIIRGREEYRFHNCYEVSYKNCLNWQANFFRQGVKAHIDFQVVSANLLEYCQFISYKKPPLPINFDLNEFLQ